MFLRSLLIAGLVAASGGVARADDPWAVGVTEPQKATAEAELELGNQRFIESDYTGALQHYRTAIASWDHPAIRFNIVRCLIQLERPIEASDELKLALRYGATPLEAPVYREALNYQKLLAAEIGELAITCTQPGVTVSLDGAHLAACPLSASVATQRLIPGPHQLVAERAGYLTKKIDVTVIGGKQVTQALVLAPLTDAARVEHRYPLWLPWAVFGGGLVIAGVGGLLELDAAGQLDSYDQTIASQCADHGCIASTADDLKQRGRHKNEIAIGVMSAGAATAIVGAVMLVMNRGTTVYGDTGPAPRTALSIAPTAGGAFATVGGSW